MNGGITKMLKALARKLTKDNPDLYKEMLKNLKKDYKAKRRGF